MQGKLSKAGAMLGLSALAGMYGSVKGALGEQSIGGAIKGAMNGYKNYKKNKGGNGEESGLGGINDIKGTLGSKAGAMDGTTATAEKMLRPGDIFSKAGKAIAGMAGSIAGSPLGPQSAILGAVGGAAAGGALGGVIGRTGASALQGIKQHGLNSLDAFKNGGIGKNKDDFAENLANEIADRDTINWANDNKEDIMKNLREQNPDVTPEELESKFQALQAQKRAQLYKNAKDSFANAKAQDGEFANGNSLVDATSQAMANKWAANNKQAFFDEYDKTNPQQAGESDEAYQARRGQAFRQKVGQIKQAFVEQGNQVLSEMGAVDSAEPVSKATFLNKLNGKISSMSGIGSAEGLADASVQVVNHVTGENVLNPNGKSNTAYLASRLAHARTQEMGEQFINSQVASGVDRATAEQQWNTKMPEVHRKNIDFFASSIRAADQKTFSNGFQGAVERLADVGVRAGNSLAVATGAKAFVNGTKQLKDVASTGIQSFGAAYFTATDMGQGGIVSHIKGFKPAASESFRSMAQSFADQNGGAVATQQKFENAIGYTAGMLLGTKGYQIAKNFASKHTPFKQAVQDSIKSAGEVAQMAQTITDPFGNKQIAPGAIRQVITKDESYIEVVTNSGETQIVSRKGAGHSGLRTGDIVYQDLDLQGDTLVPVTPKGSKTSTYRLDSTGARIPSSVNIVSNPNNLLGNPSIGKHKAASRISIPSFNQKVDSGQFYVEDLVNNGMENVEVVVEKNRKFVTAQKDGITYRVSPYLSGDARLQNSQSIKIPVQVRNGQLKPLSINDSKIAVASKIFISDPESNLQVYMEPTNEQSVKDAYFSSSTIGSLMPSKNIEITQRVINKRLYLDEVRRKQGLLG